MIFGPFFAFSPCFTAPFPLQSVLGSFLDPTADKVLVGSVMLSLGYKSLLSPWFVGLVVARDVALILGGFIIRARTKPPGVKFFDTLDASSFQITPTLVGKVRLRLVAAMSVRAAHKSSQLHS